MDAFSVLETRNLYISKDTNISLIGVREGFQIYDWS